MVKDSVVAYFSLEIGLDPKIPLYSGGLGILAGDTIKAFADTRVPVVAVSLMYKQGYFHQVLNDGNQSELPVKWEPSEFLKELPEKVKIQIEGRDVYIKTWEYTVNGIRSSVPAFFLDTDLPENSEWDRGITKALYQGDQWMRICQEMVLGIGGVKMLRKLGYNDSHIPIEKFHMNEGHAAFLTVELHKEIEHNYPHESKEEHKKMIKRKCVFTTHTPVPAGHDSFPVDLVKNAFRGYYDVDSMFLHDGKVNMTYLALNNSKHINGVAKKHRDVSRKMFPGYQIDAITNGVHSITWTCQQIQDLFDTHIPGWRRDNTMMRYSLNIPKEELWNAHNSRKQELLNFVKEKTGVEMKNDVLTIGFARRAATYKRADLIFRDIERLKHIANNKPIQIIMAGKAHPSDGGGKGLIKHIHEVINSNDNPNLKIVFLENYEMWLGKLLTSGVDVWLNTPKRPLEASGTSGMKAAHNGVLNFSVLDGWWIEGHVEDVTGWSIGPKPDSPEDSCDDFADANDLYDKLEHKLLPTYYDNKNHWKEMMLHSISHNGSFFNTQRMVGQYVLSCYFG